MQSTVNSPHMAELPYIKKEYTSPDCETELCLANLLCESPRGDSEGFGGESEFGGWGA